MNRSKLFALLTAIVVLLSLFPHPAYACSCAPHGTPLESLSAADAVFAGEVIDIDAPGPVDGIVSSADPVSITSQVQTVWKGPVEPRLTVTTARDGASCGYAFEPGRSYLVYAFGDDVHLETHLCTRNAPLSAAAEDLSALGEGTIPPEAGLNFVPMLVVFVIGVAAAALAVNVRNRRL